MQARRSPLPLGVRRTIHMDRPKWVREERLL